MGNLTKETPYSEITATLEVLAHLGVEKRHLELIRKDPKRASVVAQTMIAGYVLVEPSLTAFQPWRIIKLGTGQKTANDFRKAIKKANCKVSDWASDILGKPEFSVAATKEIEVDLVNISVSELGFPNGATREKIYKRAQELGLQLCPPEVGPQLRLQYKDQPMNEWLLIGMKPVTGSDGNLKVFNVERNDNG
jgi:hypothetical protein